MDTKSTDIECEIGTDDFDMEPPMCWLWATEATGGIDSRAAEDLRRRSLRKLGFQIGFFV